MSGTQFNIGQQQAGVINNVGRDLNVDRIEGTLQVGNQLVADLRSALDRTPMPGPTRVEAGRVLDEVERELERPDPDKPGIAARLEGHPPAGQRGRAGSRGRPPPAGPRQAGGMAGTGRRRSRRAACLSRCRRRGHCSGCELTDQSQGSGQRCSILSYTTSLRRLLAG